MRLRRGCAVGVLAGIAILGGLYLARGRVLPAMARWLDVGGPPQRAEYVMVLGGDENVRPFVGAALVRVGWAQQVLLADLLASPDIHGETVPPRHEISRRVLIARGVPERAIVTIGEKCESTFDEARALAEWFHSAPRARVMVVTSDYHTRRARWVFARALGDRAAQVSFLSVPVENFQADNWWQNEDGFIAITGEYVKLVLYAVRYGYLGYWLAAVVVALVVVVLIVRRLETAS